MGRKRIYADDLERQRLYQRRKRAKTVEALILAQAARRIIAAARFKGYVPPTLSEVQALEHLAGDMTSGLTPEQLAKVLSISK